MRFIKKDANAVRKTCSTNKASTIYGQMYVDTLVHILVYISGVVFDGFGYRLIIFKYEKYHSCRF